MVPRRPQRPSALVGVAGLAAASAVLLLPGSLSGQSAEPNATAHVVRGNVSLPVAKKALGQFKEVRLRKGASVGFRQDSRGPFLQFADSRRSGYVTVSTADGAPQRHNGFMSASTSAGLGIIPKMAVLGPRVVDVS